MNLGADRLKPATFHRNASAISSVNYLTGTGANHFGFGDGENLMSKKAAGFHTKASEHLAHAARHHEEAAKHHESGRHETAAHHAHIAMGHTIHARGHSEEAVKAHVEEYGKK
jgi:hypothetical protein